jgi:hypothetical protein
VEASYSANVVGVVGALGLAVKHAWDSPVLDHWLFIVFGVGNPHDLHLSLLPSQSQVELFVSCFETHFDLGYPDELLQSNITVRIGVEELEDGSGVFFLHVMFWFDEPR